MRSREPDPVHDATGEPATRFLATAGTGYSERERGGLVARADLLRTAAVFLAIAVISSLHYLAPPKSVQWHYLAQRLFYLPVAFAALSYGWRGGLAAAALAGLSYIPYLWANGDFLPVHAASQYLEIIVFCSVGLLVGLLADRERRQKAACQRVATKLTEAHRELRESFEAMKRAERLSALGQLSAGLAHEIRNPLASISGAAGILRRHPGSEQKCQECLSIIDRETRRLNRLLTNFLDFARPRAPNYRVVDVNGVLDSVITLAGHAVGRKTITFRKVVPPGLPAVECDPEQLEQVLLNLTINAIQATEESGEVILACRTANGKLLIEVKDQGSGVHPDHIDRLFDPFFTTKETGTGLGLPVAYRIVRQFGGVLSAARNDDAGMTFSVTLPLQARSRHETTEHTDR